MPRLVDEINTHHFSNLLGLISVAIEPYKPLNFHLAYYNFTPFAIRHHRRRVIKVFGRMK